MVSHKYGKIVAVAAAAVMLVGLLGPSVPARAEGEPTVPTTARVSGNSTPPVVEWAWVLPDMQSNVAGIQYGTVADAHQHDDDMTVAPNPAAIPAAHNMMQVFPNLEDLPEMKQIEYWAAVQDPMGVSNITDVFIQVFHPDQSLKYQLHMTSVACSALGSATTTGSVLEAAVHSGQMTVAEADLIVELCGKNFKKVYKVVGELSKHQPAGEYTIKTTAINQSGGFATLTNWFDVLPIVGLMIDFNAINWGDILPNTPKWLPGDYNFTPPADTRPTVKNVGNTCMYLSLKYSPMVGLTFQKIINEFDAQLDTEKIEPIPANTWVKFQHCLGSNVLGQLDLSIHPGTIPADTYNGSLALMGSAS